MTNKEKIKRLKIILNKRKNEAHIFISLIFIVFTLLAIIIATYSISSDLHYVSNVNSRAFNSNNGDITNAVISHHDAMNTYESKVWRLKHKELYYLEIGLIFMIFAILASIFYKYIHYDTRIEPIKNKISELEWDEEYY